MWCKFGEEELLARIYEMSDEIRDLVGCSMVGSLYYHILAVGWLEAQHF